MKTRAINALCGVVMLGVFATPVPARAQVDTAISLGSRIFNKLLPDDWLGGTEFFKMLSLLQEATGYMRDTAVFAQEAVQVGKNVEAILDDPAEFAAYSARGWTDSFPQVYNILANAEQIRLSMHRATHPQDLPNYDPMAYVNAFDALKNMNDSRFATFVAALDVYGIGDGEDATLKELQVEHKAATDHLRKVADIINRSGMSSVDAAIETSLATAIEAAAASRAAGTLHEMQKVAALKLVGMVAGKHEARRKVLDEEIAIVNMNAPTWRLDPFRHAQSKFKQ